MNTDLDALEDSLLRLGSSIETQPLESLTPPADKDLSAAAKTLFGSSAVLAKRYSPAAAWLFIELKAAFTPWLNRVNSGAFKQALVKALGEDSPIGRAALKRVLAEGFVMMETVRERGSMGPVSRVLEPR